MGQNSDAIIIPRIIYYKDIMSRRTSGNSNNTSRWVAVTYAVLIAILIILTYLYPTDSSAMAKHHLTLTQARLASFSITIPLIFIWLIAIRGALALSRYARRIEKDQDGVLFKLLAKGLVVLAIYLPIRAILRIGSGYLVQMHPELSRISNIVITYINLVMPLIAFILISKAARGLAIMAKARPSQRAIHGLVIAFAVLAVGYCYLLLNVNGTIAPNNWLIATNQYFSTPVLLFTVAAPYLYLWFIGLSAAYEILLYQRHVDGVIYKKSLRLLSIGFGIVMIFSILLQFITSISSMLTSLSFSLVLLMAYSFLIIVAIGFGLISRGVRNLEKIEELEA